MSRPYKQFRVRYESTPKERYYLEIRDEKDGEWILNSAYDFVRCANAPFETEVDLKYVHHELVTRILWLIGAQGYKLYTGK